MPVQYEVVHKKREGINYVIDVKVFAMPSQKKQENSKQVVMESSQLRASCWELASWELPQSWLVPAL